MKKFLIVFIIFFLIGSVGAAGYFYKQYRDVKNNPSKVSNDELVSIVNAINKNMDLPTDETPTMATVTDRDKLQDQVFFKNAQNGDKIIIYINAKKAILWRPSTERIIEFAPVLTDNSTQLTSTQEETLTPDSMPIKVAIYNGTKENNLSGEIEKKIGDINNLTVVIKKNAAKTNYTQSIVIDVSGSYSDRAMEIATKIGGAVATLPEGEEKPDADILIIAGK